SVLYCLSLLKRNFFFFHNTAPTELYTLSLHDALPISVDEFGAERDFLLGREVAEFRSDHVGGGASLKPLVIANVSQGVVKLLGRSEEHTSELQSRRDLVCRLLLEKKKIYEMHLE